MKNFLLIISFILVSVNSHALVLNCKAVVDEKNVYLKAYPVQNENESEKNKILVWMEYEDNQSFYRDGSPKRFCYGECSSRYDLQTFKLVLDNQSVVFRTEAMPWNLRRGGMGYYANELRPNKKQRVFFEVDYNHQNKTAKVKSGMNDAFLGLWVWRDTEKSVQEVTFENCSID